MRFSLIVATINRTTELHDLLTSLTRQTYREFEVIVVDQNADDRLVPILKFFGDRLQILRLKSPSGLSRARNAGLRAARGDVICFPDDDCRYSENVLEAVKQHFAANPKLDGVVGDSIDETGQRILPLPSRKGRVTRTKWWRLALSITIFLKREMIEAIGTFDETLGLGAGSPWGCGEDIEYVLRALRAGFRFTYDPEILVFHPKVFLELDKAGLTKRYSYAKGQGKLCQKHPMPLWWIAVFFSISGVRAILAAVTFNFQKSQAEWLIFKGRLEGLLSSRNA